MENSARKILAVLGGLGTLVHAEHTAELACHLCEGRRADLVLGYPIIVPLTAALDARLPTQERAAQDAIECGLRAVAQRNCRATIHVVRHRDPAEAILELARDERADVIVLGIHVNPNVPRDYDRAETAEDEILRRAECEVIIDREPLLISDV
ncbi:MAG: universal stress protein [Chloroflexi bacterium]|nr:universal stress protein [Chloroflexota bacterium]